MNTKIYLLIFTLFILKFSNGQCLNANYGVSPAAPFTPSCTGSAEVIIAGGFAGQYSRVNLLSDVSYNFQSSVATDYITISTDDGITPLASGPTPFTYKPTTAGTVRFYTHTNNACGSASLNRTRSIQCSFDSCSSPINGATGLTLNATSQSSFSGSFTAAAANLTGYLVVRYTGGTVATAALPVTGTNYAAGSTISATGFSTGTVVSSGTATTFNATGLTAATAYDVVVYAYNARFGCTITYRTNIVNGQNSSGVVTTSCPVLPQEITIGATGSNFTSLTQAITVLSGCPVNRPQVIALQANYTSTSETFPLNLTVPGASSINTITIKPANGAGVSITGNLPSNSLIKIIGSYITIDGSNNGSTSRDLTIRNTSTIAPQAVLVGSVNNTPVTNIVIKNTIISNGSVNSSTAIMMSNTATPAGAGYFNNIDIQNNRIERTNTGIYAMAAPAANNGNGINITNNLMNSLGENSIASTGIYLQGTNGALITNNIIANFDSAADNAKRGIGLGPANTNTSIKGNVINTLKSVGVFAIAPAAITVNPGVLNANISIDGNTISDIVYAGLSSSKVVAISVFGNCSGVTIRNNKIRDIRSRSGTDGAYGIELASTSTAANISVINNFILDVAAVGNFGPATNGTGIAVLSGAGYNIYYNTVNLSFSQRERGLPSALLVSNGVTVTGALRIANNVFANNEGPETNPYSVYSGASNNVYALMDYNDYHCTTHALAFIDGFIRTSLLGLQQGFGQNLNSTISAPVFVSATDLHLNAQGNPTLDNKGIPVSGIVNDIDGDLRSTNTPDIGADEIFSTLPVTLAEFNGVKRPTGNYLWWSTSTESGSAGFELQRSSDGVTFGKLCFIPTRAINGNSTSKIIYDFTDPYYATLSNYYRLAQTDLTGRTHYSKILYIQGSSATTLTITNIFPNPATNILQVNVIAPTTNKITLSVTGANGKTFLTKTTVIAAGGNVINLPVQSLVPGSYYIKVAGTNNKDGVTQSFMKQ